MPASPSSEFDSRSSVRTARHLRRIAILAIVAGILGGCATISIPLDGFTATGRAPSDAEMTTGSLRAPVDRVVSSTLPPLPVAAAPAAPAQATTLALAPPSSPMLEERHAVAIRAALPAGMLEAERAPTVPWLHEPSRTGGVISPVGAPIRQGEATCRAVVVSIEHDGTRRFVQGNACRAPGYDWSLLDLRPWTNPA